MLKKLLSLLLTLALVLGLGACGPQTSRQEDDGTLTLAAVTYPVYLFARELTRGAAGVEVTLIINQSVSCVHDYTLSVRDMKVLDGADVVLLNGAGLEDSMSGALEAAHTPQIDCSAGIELLASSHDHDHDHGHGDEAEEAHDHEDEDHDHASEPAHDHEDGEDHDHEAEAVQAHEEDGHDHEGEADPHIWMDPLRACQMLENLAQGLADLDPANAALYAANAQAAVETVTAAYEALLPLVEDLACRDLITFHDGFPYFAEAFDLTILRSIEEEAGSEASAKDVIEIVEELSYHHIPAIFTEVNGATATAQLIQRETGVAVYPLTMLMSGETDNVGIDTYIDGITANVKTIQEACS